MNNNHNNYKTEHPIPSKYRKMENLHIVFWLFKDLAWCLGIKILGVTMIFPTLIFSIIITYRNKNSVSELCHTLAVTLWIIANSYWMLSEFFEFDSKAIWGFTYKHIAIIPFAIGIIILGYYYLFFKPKNVE